MSTRKSVSLSGFAINYNRETRDIPWHKFNALVRQSEFKFADVSNVINVHRVCEY